MKNYGFATLQDFLGDRILFRNLNALDLTLPRLDDLRHDLMLPANIIPRKTSLDYARVIIELVRHARRQDGNQTDICHVIYVGDTRMNDGMAFRNICASGHWRGAAMIIAEDDALSRLEQQQDQDTIIFFNNHWVNLRIFHLLLQMKEIELNEQTVVLIDMDKTALGARGRNDAVIDGARVKAAQAVLQEVLMGAFDADEFARVYSVLNQPAYHPFTADNQDYLVYICLILLSGLFKLEDIVTGARLGLLSNFDGFLDQVEQRYADLPVGVQKVHHEIYHLVKSGDATPFKQFRKMEYHATMARMGQLSSHSPIEDLLQQEIVITREVQEFAVRCRKAGATLFGLSDKPDEASMPSSQESDLKPLNQIPTHMIGAKNE